MRMISMITASILLMVGCSSSTTTSGGCPVKKENLGKQIMIEGWAVNRAKASAQVVGSNFAVWIDEKEFRAWPKNIYSGGDTGKKVRVTGVLAEDHAYPVFVQRKGGPALQGVPVPEGTSMEEASHRWILKQVHWEAIEK